MCGCAKQRPMPKTVPPNQATRGIRADVGARVTLQPLTSGMALSNFEYVGATGLTVISPATGKRYRFDGPGARLAIDARDQAWLGSVPNLRQLGRR